MKTYCRAILRPEGIACTLEAGHDPFPCQGITWDHVHIYRSADWGFSRPGPAEWGFNNPLGRKLEEE